ncbi:MAG TPA: peptide chain release factor 1, partial [Thermoplasmatales archaeon]|nr:peptide chain release factor 1 [Thermoplasmatales archaeon]
LDVIKDRRLMQRFLNEIRKDSGLAIYGEEEVKNALTAGAVESLLISDALEKYRIKAKCKSCGYEINEVREKVDEIKCPTCNIPMEIVEKKDIVEEYAELAENSGAEVEIIGRESEEGEILYKAFGGIAAILRYKWNGG